MAVTVVGTPADTGTNVVATSHSVNLPSGIQSGERLTLFCALFSVASASIPGWSAFQVSGGANGAQVWCFYKEATGSEGATATLTTNVASAMTGRVWRLSGHDSAVAPEGTGTDYTSTDVVLEVPPLSPSWGAAETLWFVFAVPTNDGRSITDFPDGYTSTGSVFTTQGLRMGYGLRTNNVATEDPTSFSVSQGSGGQAVGLAAIKPSAGVTLTRINKDTDLRWRTLSTTSNRISKSLEARWRVFFTAGTPGTMDESWSGAVTATSFVAAGRHQGATAVRLVVSTALNLSNPTYFGPVSPDGQGYAKIEATGLAPNTQYHYGWESNGNLLATPRGRARTFPSGAASFSIIAVGDAHRQPAQGTVPDRTVYARMANEAPLLQLWTGDYYYEDEATEAFSTNIQTYRDMWHSTFDAGPNRDRLINEIPIALTWGDHDSVGNNATRLSAGWTQAHANFRQIFPHYPLSATDRITQSFEIGRVKFFLLDVQSFRDPPENANTATKSMLGVAQKAEFKAWLLANKDAAKVVVSSYPWQGRTLDNEGHWGYYPNEQTELVNYIAANSIRNIVMVGSDMHALAFAAGNTPGNLTPGQIPVIQAAPAFRPSASHKGGPYDKGPFPADGASQPEQYGLLSFTDTGGSNITLTFSARDELGATVFSDSVITFTNVGATNLTRISRDVEARWRTFQAATRITRNIDFRWKIAGSQNTDVTLTLESPPRNLVVGAVQEFRIEARKVGTGPHPTLTAYLYDSGTQIAELLTDQVLSSTSGQLFIATWNASLLPSLSGAGVEVRVLIEGTTTGYGELVDVEWNSTYEATPTTRILKDMFFRWAAIARTWNDTDLRWRIEAPLTRVSRDVEYRWRLFSRIQSTTTLSWRTLGTVGKETDFRWKASSRVSESFSLRWSTFALVDRSSDFRWRVLLPETRVTRDVEYRWRTEVSLTRISQTIDLPWRTYSTVAQEAQFQWKVFGGVSAETDLRWRVLSDVPQAGIEIVDAVVSTEPVDTQTHDVPLPAGSGGLLIAFASINGNPTVSNVPWGATVLVDTPNGGTTGRALVFCKFADGSETASAFNTSTAEHSVTRVIRLSGVHTSTPPEVAFVPAVASTTVDPPSLDPAGWGSEPAMWFAAALRINGTTVASAYPDGYGTPYEDRTTTGSQGASLSVVSRILNTGAEDPTPFTLATARSHVAITLAVRPASVTSLSRVEKDLDVRWRVDTRISKDTDLRWRTFTALAGEVEFSWRAFAPVGKSLEIQFSTYGRVRKAVNLHWSTLVSVGREAHLWWAVRRPNLSKDIEYRWRTGFVCPKGLTWGNTEYTFAQLEGCTFEDLAPAPIIRDLDLRWSLLTRVTKNTNLRWRTYGKVSQDLDLRWKTYGSVLRDLDLRWKAYGFVQSSLDLRWRTYAPVSKSLDFRWRTTGRLQKDLEARWTTEAAPNKLTRDTDFRWSTSGRISQSVDFRWATFAIQSKSLTLSWRTYGFVGKGLDLRWRTLLKVGNGATFSWRTFQLRQRDADLRWRTLQIRQRDTDLRWRTLVRLQRDLDLRWVVFVRAFQDGFFRWRDLQSVIKTVDLHWSNLSRLQRDTDLRWRIAAALQGVQKSVDLRWRASARIQRDVNYRWRTETFDLIVDTDGIIRPKIYAFGEVKPKIRASWYVAPKVYAEGEIEENVYVEGYTRE